MLIQKTLNPIQRPEVVVEGLIIRQLPLCEARLIRPVVDAVVHPAVDPVNLTDQVARHEVGRIGGSKLPELSRQHSDDVRGLVADDGGRLLVEQDGNLQRHASVRAQTSP